MRTIGLPLRGAIAFGLGSIFVFLTSLNLMSYFDLVLEHYSYGMGHALILLVAGVLAGLSLGCGALRALGFGVGFVCSSIILLLGSLSSMATGTTFWVMTVALLLTGLIGSISLSLGFQVVIISTLGFALCGLLGDLIVWAQFQFNLWGVDFMNENLLSPLAIFVAFPLAGAIAGAAADWGKKRRDSHGT